MCIFILLPNCFPHGLHKITLSSSVCGICASVAVCVEVSALRAPIVRYLVLFLPVEW